MTDARDCVVKLVDDHGVEHSVRVRAESVYEAALIRLQKLERVGPTIQKLHVIVSNRNVVRGHSPQV